MSVSQLPAPSAPRQPRIRINRNLGSGAGLTAFAIVLYAVVGALWGVLRPAYDATAMAEAQVAISPTGNVGFTVFMTFVVLTGLLGLVLGIGAYLSSPNTRGLGMLLWVGVVAFVAAIGFWAVGEFTADLRYPLPDVASLTEGTELSVAASLSPGLALVAAPLMATASYWVSALLYLEDDDAGMAPAAA